MNATHGPIGIVEGRALLDALPGLYFAALKKVHLEADEGDAVRCSFELPEIGRRTQVADTAIGAIRATLAELSDILTHSLVQDWPREWHGIIDSISVCWKESSLDEHGERERFQAKARQLTIGVTMPVKLKASVQAIAEEQQASFASIARELTAVGFEDFDDRIFVESSKNLLATLESEVNRWLPSDKEQVMLRLDPNIGIRLRSVAKEYSKSASEFGVLFLAHGYDLKNQIINLENKIKEIRGPAARSLASEVGLGEHVPLLLSILSGMVTAPKRILSRLSVVFECSENTISEFLDRSFENREVPSFKAERGKPQVAVSAMSWVEAVESLGLPEKEAKKLIQLDE